MNLHNFEVEMHMNKKFNYLLNFLIKDKKLGIDLI